MSSILRGTVDQIDSLLARFSLALLGDRSSLIIPIFHGIYPKRASARSALFDPQQGVTLDQFRLLLSSFAKAGFSFIRPDYIDDSLERGGKYVMLTFDDGYFNNLSALPLLHEFAAPAVFFASARHIKTGKALWWDVLYREMTSAGMPASHLRVARARLKTLRNEEIENWLRAEFQLERLQPTGDLDRPMTPWELKELSNDRYAVIGNHTLDHAILTNYSYQEAIEQIEGGQQELLEMTGKLPTCIAYPNGNWTPQIAESAMRMGLMSGVVTLPGRNALPIPAGGIRRMTLKRVWLWGNRDIESQCKEFRSAFSFSRFITRAHLYRPFWSVKRSI